MLNKAKLTVCLGLIFSFVTIQNTFAKNGDMGFFGGISQGTPLPKTTEILLENAGELKKAKNKVLKYKEVVFLDGKPVTFEGTLTVKPGEPKEGETLGTYKETYVVTPGNSTDPNAQINRDITFNVNFRIENNQVIKDYEIDKWNETITLGDKTFVLDPKKSKFGVSILEDHTPGVVYYKGDISQQAVYISGKGEEEGNTVLDVSGAFYGYDCAQGNTETHRLDATIIRDDWQMQYQVRPSVSVAKLIQYSKNEPKIISFEGNFKEVMENTSGLEYDIFVKPKQLYEIENSGKVNIPTYNSFEQLIAPDMGFLKGHFAEYNIKRLFSMQILEGEPENYLPDQAITRGQYVTAIAKAIKLPINEEYANKKPKKGAVEVITFPDVTNDRPEYPYIMAAYENGVAVGRNNGHFYTDSPIDRQEAVVLLVRTLGLENLALDPLSVTEFADDKKIASWAKREIYAGEAMGISLGDEDGNFRPDVYVTKAEAAAFLNRFVDYMRNDITLDYTDHIVNYSN